MNQKEWHAEVVKQYVLQDTNSKKLADELGYSYQHILSTVSGQTRTRPAIEAISKRLGIEPYSE